MLTIIALVVLAIVGYYLYTHRGGREFYAIGSDPTRRSSTASRHAGASSAPSSSAAPWPASPACSTPPATARSAPAARLGLELQAVGAAVIGGVAIFGGSGTVWGAAIGAFLLVTINRALPSLGIEDFWQRAVVGALILGAIVLDRVLANRQERKLAEARGTMTTTSTPPPAHLRRVLRPLWEAACCWTREFAVIALLVAVSSSTRRQRPELRRPAHAQVPASTTSRRSCSSPCR